MLSRRRIVLACALVLALVGIGAAFSRLGTEPRPGGMPPPAAAASPSPRILATGDLAARLAAMERELDRRRDELGIPGLSLAVVQGDEAVYLGGLGLRDLERNLPVTVDTLFSTGSSTKSFTALLAVMAQDEGKLSLDDHPRKYLPYFRLRDPAADAAVTVRHLLSHRTGLVDDVSLWYGSGLGREETIRAALKAAAADPLGAKFHYNNITFSAAGEVVARAQGSTWERLIAERIFRPLGMAASDTSVAAMQQSADYSLGYSPGRPNARMPSMDVGNVAASGAINSNARDMAQWLRVMLGGGVFGGRRLVSERGFAQLFEKHIPMGKKGHYCLGWMAQEWQGQPVFTHGGAIDGYSGMVALMPGRHLGFAMLTNVAVSDLLQEGPEIVWRHLAAAERPLPAPPVPAR